MQCGLLHLRRLILDTAHLKVPITTHLTLDDQPTDLDGQWLHEEDAAQGRLALGRRARHLEVAGAWEDDAALHDVVGDEGVQRTRGGRAEDVRAVWHSQPGLHHRVRRR